MGDFMDEQNRQPYTYGNESEQNVYNDKHANHLCIISLACSLLPPIITAIIITIVSALTGPEYSDIPSIIMNILGTIDTLGVIAGIAMMIYVRVKYPGNTFGKVLMWLYIILAALAVILFIIYMVVALVACISCLSCLNDMPG